MGETMVNMDARKLVEAANVISGFHLRDSLTRLQFFQEIRDVVEKQLIYETTLITSGLIQ